MRLSVDRVSEFLRTLWGCKSIYVNRVGKHEQSCVGRNHAAYRGYPCRRTEPESISEDATSQQCVPKRKPSESMAVLKRESVVMKTWYKPTGTPMSTRGPSTRCPCGCHDKRNFANLARTQSLQHAVCLLTSLLITQGFHSDFTYILK